MKTIKFIKAHPVGISEGKVVTRDNAFCDRMIADKYAVEIDAEEATVTTPEPEIPQEKPAKTTRRKKQS